jgi:hypothetical protein
VDAEPERLEDDCILLSRLEHIDACARNPYVLLGIEHMGAFRSVPSVNYSCLAATGTQGVLSQIAEYTVEVCCLLHSFSCERFAVLQIFKLGSNLLAMQTGEHLILAKVSTATASARPSHLREIRTLTSGRPASLQGRTRADTEAIARIWTPVDFQRLST